MQLSAKFVVLGLFGVVAVEGNDSDLFNYGFSDKRENGARSFGQKNWEDVTCSNLDSCVSAAVGKLFFRRVHCTSV